ncbi:DUF7287 family protein [Halorientalis halophila]|uniref:DUF7287 family protein n=1 Tax=Halorientalis halophila TaxID=3108499 RepID=UPI0030093E89
MNGRGQTTHDYLAGVSILLLTVLFIFGYVPGVFGSTGMGVGGVEQSQADRAATYLVDAYAVDGSEQTLDYNGTGGIHDELRSDAGWNQFRERTGLNSVSASVGRPFVNVVLVNSSELNATGPPTPIDDDEGRHSYGSEPNLGQSVATSTRVVRFDADGAHHCNPTCWLVVRVW